jgi:hypothetical protein
MRRRAFIGAVLQSGGDVETTRDLAVIHRSW